MSTDGTWSLAPTEDQDALYDVALQITDEVLGEGSYAQINRSNPDPKIQAALRRAQQ
jgi:hypothetical protein